MAFHVVDEGAQLWHHLAASRMVQKDARRHGGEGIQHANQSAGRHRFGGDRLGHLRETRPFERRAQMIAHFAAFYLLVREGKRGLTRQSALVHA